MIPPESPTRAQAMQVWGYVPNYDRDAAWATVQAHEKHLTGVSLFQYRLDAEGNLADYPDLRAVPRWARERGVAVAPMVTNLVGEDWDRALVARVLADADRRRRHLERLVELVVQNDYPALELDYENLSAEERGPLTAFVQELVEALHERGKQLSLALHAKLNEPGEWPGAQAQDWSGLGAAADRIVIMTYDHDPSRPGPIAPIEWTRAVLRFALSQISPDRVLQGIPFYGYDWSETGSDRVGGSRAPKPPAEYRTYREVMALAQAQGAQPHREATDRHLVLEYQEAGAAHEVWIPDGETVAALLDVGRELGVGGFAIWRMGGEDPSVWQAIEKAVSPG